MLVDPETQGVIRGSESYLKSLREFFTEASMLVSLRHVNVIRVYGVSTDSEGIPWLLMEVADFTLDKVRPTV